MNRSIALVISAAALLASATAWAKDKVVPVKDRPPATETKPAAGAKPEAPVPAKAALQVVEVAVTKAGFVPAEIRVKAGQPVKLMVTRKIEKTCAKDIVIKDYNVNQPLPLNQTVEVVFTPGKPGTARFACAMDMIAGVIIAE